jgi:hypothetical protein
MRWIREQLKVLWMYQAMDHEEILGAIDEGASYRSRWKHYQAMDQTIKGWMVDGSVKN